MSSYDSDLTLYTDIVSLEVYYNTEETLISGSQKNVWQEYYQKYSNIDNYKIASTNHVWNLVYIEGQWLHLDLTWDDAEDPRFQNNYFLITKEKLHKLDREEHLYDEEFFLEAF